MSFPTQFDKHERVFMNPGSRFADVYVPIIDKETGHYELEIDPNQRKDIYAEIQSHKDSVDIHRIVACYEAGDTNALQRVQGMYGDLTSVPKNIFEYKEMEERICANFDQLPADIKQRFDNSYLQFAMQAGTDEWFNKLGYTSEQIKPRDIEKDHGGDSE